MKNHTIYSQASCFLLAVVLFLMCFSASGYAIEADKGMKVRVGYFQMNGYQDVDFDGRKYGYGYEFLQMVRRYSDVSYEYVVENKSWHEYLDMLQRGEIDLLTNVHKTQARQAEFDFSYPIGTNSIVLHVRDNDSRYVPEQYVTYNGMIVGTVEGSVATDKLRKFVSDHGFSVTHKIFTSHHQMEQALARGEIDAICVSSMLKIENSRILDTFATENIYAVVRKGNKALLEKINYAIKQMDKVEPEWREQLFSKYLINKSNFRFEFTEAEKAYIAQHSKGKKKIIVGTDKHWRPYSWFENGEYKGIFVDYWKELMQYVGIDYEFFRCDDEIYDEGVMKYPEIDIYIASNADFQLAENSGFVSSPVYYEPTVALLRRKGTPVIRTLAISKTTPALNRQFPPTGDMTSREYDSTEAAIEAVMQGEADGVYIYNYVAQMYANSDNSGDLMISYQNNIKIPIRMIVREGENRELISIVSKCIAMKDNIDMTALAANYITSPKQKVSWIDFLGQHSIGVSLLIAVLAIGFLLYKRRQDGIITQKTQAALQAAEEANAAKTSFLFTMSHDIRTPMNAIMGFTELLKRHQEDPEKRKEYLEKISKSSSVLLSIINNVLEMGRIEKGQMKLIEVPHKVGYFNETLYNVFDDLMSEKNITFTHTQNVTHQFIYCDVSKLREVFLNILSNAYQYTPEGGKVDLLTEEMPSDRDGYILFQTTITDTGIGMSKEFQKHIFEEFSREYDSTTRNIEGTGLGMSIVKRLIDAMGGKITVKSREGKGTTFCVSVYHRIASEEDFQKKEEEKAQMNVFANTRILMAEDNDLNAEIATDILQEAGFAVDRAEDGERCVQMLLKAEPGYYDVVLMDVQMPVMNGYDATRAIRHLNHPQRANIPIIAMTANAFEEDKREAFSAGMNAHVAKPIDITVLFATLTNMLRK